MLEYHNINLVILNQFIKSFFPAATRVSQRTPGSSWFMQDKKTFLDCKLYLDHIAGKTTYGIVLGNYYKKFFCIDFDRQERQTEENYRKLVSYVRNIFQCPSISLTSSESKNIHLYFFIKRANPYLVYDRVYTTLYNHNIKPAPGFVEIYTTRNLRLPFGHGSKTITDDFEYAELDINAELEQFTNYLNSEDLPSIYEATPTYRSIPHNIKTVNSVVFSNIDEVFTKGLEAEGTRNKTFLEYGIYLAKVGLSEDDISTKLIEFIDIHGYNSKEYRENPGRVYSKARAVAKSIISKNFNYIESKSVKVDEFLCNIVFNYFKKYGYSNQIKIFKLFQYLKKRSLLNKNFIPLPKKLLVTIFKLNTKIYRLILNDLEELGIIRSITTGNNLKQHPTIYKWTATISNDSRQYSDFNEFLKVHKYKNKYSYYIAKEI